MKKLYIIGGTMGVGKTTVCNILKKRLDMSVMLDGDWCWDINPFIVNSCTKKLVLDNICYMLNNFIGCNEIENIIFCWVLHNQEIIDTILSRINLSDCEIINISLVCDQKNLIKRLEKDILSGKRNNDIIDRSVNRLACYSSLKTLKIDTSNINEYQTAEIISTL